MTYEDLSKIVFESETSRQASVGRMTTEAHWAAVARRLAVPASESSGLREEFFAGDVLDRELVEYIQSLRPQFKTGLLSNAWPDTRDYLAQNSLIEAFDVVIISAEVGVMKPDPAIFELALKQLEVTPPEAVLIDDTNLNVEAAQKFGMRGILFRDPRQMRSELKTLLQ